MAPTPVMDQCVENTKSHYTWERSYPLELCSEISYFTPNLPWDLTVLFQLRPADICTMEREDKVGFLVWHQIPFLVHLLLPDNAVSLGRHAWNAQSGQIPKAAATLISKDQATV